MSGRRSQAKVTRRVSLAFVVHLFQDWKVVVRSSSKSDMLCSLLSYCLRDIFRCLSRATRLALSRKIVDEKKNLFRLRNNDTELEVFAPVRNDVHRVYVVKGLASIY